MQCKCYVNSCLCRGQIQVLLLEPPGIFKYVQLTSIVETESVDAEPTDNSIDHTCVISFSYFNQLRFKPASLLV